MNDAIAERNDEYRDTFTREHAHGYSVSRVSVELCHGVWCTFAYFFADIGDPLFRRHTNREDARTAARRWLAALRV